MGKRGPKPIQINWDEVDKLVSYQCTQEEVASFFDISLNTLERACERDRGQKLGEFWHKKRNLGRVKLRKLQFGIIEKGGSGAATMAIYLDKKIFPDERPDLVLPPTPHDPVSALAKTPDMASFSEFCVKAGYPAPFPKQEEMRAFGIDDTDPRMILGARGYGKTDYVTILGVAYEVYLDWFSHRHRGTELEETNLIISKSKTRNTAMIEEIANALEANGVPLEKQNSTCIRVEGLRGKDHSVEVITIKTSMRGRHPKRVLMDDPVTEEDVSEAMRVMVKRKYNEVMKLCSNVLVIGQPAHAHDLYAELRPMVKKLELAHGSIPELDHDLEAQRMAGVDENSIQASYFLNVVSEGTTPFDKIRYIDRFPTGGHSVAFIDPSHMGGDYTALTILKAYMDGVAAVGFVWKKAWNHCLDETCSQLLTFGVKKLCIETNGLGDQPVIMLRDLLGQKGIGVVGKPSNSNKHSRIMSAGSYAHLIHLSKQSDATYTKQVVQYEYKAKHDDGPDSLASCLEWIGLIRGKT
jgi:hypothetical protein